MLAIFYMSKDNIIKISYFNIHDFFVNAGPGIFDTKIDFDQLKDYSVLIPWRFKKSESYIQDIDKLRCILSGILIYKSFGKVEEKIRYNKYGKPYFENKEWNFSISHSGDYVLFVRDTEKIGIDIEKICDENIDILEYSFNDREKAIIGSDVTKLTKLWTRKESIYKASGLEEMIEFRDIDVTDSLDNMPIELIKRKYNVISDRIDDYYVSIASIKKYQKMLFLKEFL